MSIVELQRHLAGRRSAQPGRHRLARVAQACPCRDQRRLPRLAGASAKLSTSSPASAKTTLDEPAACWQRNSERHLKRPAEMAQLLRRPARSHRQHARNLRRGSTSRSPISATSSRAIPCRDGRDHDVVSCASVTDEGARRRYRPYHDRARQQIERELALIEKLDLAGYFLIVWDIVRFCRENGILVQGRGSAANSAVCYALGITAVDPVGMDLLFERFLSEERGEWPDIDLDLPSGDQRERVIQYVYQRYGKLRRRHDRQRHHLSRPLRRARGRARRSASTSPTLGHARRAWCRIGNGTRPERHARSSSSAKPASISRIRASANSSNSYRIVQDLPRHLGQHSGGMVICQGQLDAVVPLEPATMPGRVVVQWDKEDCADLGIIKVDLLGPRHDGGARGLPSRSSATTDGEEVDLAHLPQRRSARLRSASEGRHRRHVPGREPRADGVAAAHAPRAFLRHRGAGRDHPPRAHRRQDGASVSEPAAGPRDGRTICIRRSSPCCERTLGVPLFQEQLLRMAMIAANFTGGEAEELRRAMGFKRSEQRMSDIEVKLRAGMTANGIDGEAQEQIVQSITSFALYGFPESHAASFALLAYASAYLKCPLSRRVHLRHAEQSADGLLSSVRSGEGRAAPRPARAAGRRDLFGLELHCRGR